MHQRDLLREHVYFRPHLRDSFPGVQSTYTKEPTTLPALQNARVVFEFLRHRDRHPEVRLEGDFEALKSHR